MSDADSVYIKVRSEALKSKADDTDRALNDLRTKLEALEDIMNRTRGYWIGEAGEKHLALYNTQKEKTNDVLRRWTEYPKKLREMAGVYEETEEANVQVSDILSGDVIE